MDINNVSLTGRLTKDIDLKYTQSGTAVGSFTLAVTRKFKDKTTNQYGADFIQCAIWRKGAETLSGLAKKGMRIGVEGFIQTRHYENQQGQRIYVTEIVVDNFTIYDKIQQKDNNLGYNQPNVNNDNNNNTYNQSYNSNPFNVPDSTPIDIEEDQLPFNYSPA